MELFKHKLTKRQKEVLSIIQYNDENDIMCDGKEVWVGWEQSNWKLVLNLLRLCVISKDSYSSGSTERFHINETGKKALEQGYIELPFKLK